jgi:hypothetical protein
MSELSFAEEKPTQATGAKRNKHLEEKVETSGMCATQAAVKPSQKSKGTLVAIAAS